VNTHAPGASEPSGTPEPSGAPADRHRYGPAVVSGRTVVISGGGTGIGLATARAFARSGDRTVLVGRRAEVLQGAAASLEGAVACPADLSEPAGAARVAAFVAREFGAVDVLIHSAGGNGAREPDAPGDEPGADPLTRVARQWTVNFRLNTLTSVLLTEALRERLASPGGRVLFITSIAAQRGSGAAGYGPSKAALHPYAHDLARQLGHRGVTVNVVAPGIIADTGFFGPDGGGMTAERWQARVDETLNGRAGTPGDVAETLHWLASPAADHITSQIIQVNGGAERGR
jgi:3-oxoacyl-[acyl-carrier protein] reductase